MKARAGENSHSHESGNPASFAVQEAPATYAIWKRVRIGDGLKLINGRAFKPSEWSQQGLPIVRIQNLNNPDAPFNHYEGDLPEKFRLKKGDLLFAWSGTPGTSFGAHIWRGDNAWLNQHIFKVIFDERQFDKRFLRFAINQNLNQYIAAAHGGAGLAHITKGKFDASTIICPLLDEQIRIVAEIEKQFSRLDEAVTNLKRVKVGLNRYKAAGLKAAFEGRLVPTEADIARYESRSYETGAQLLQRVLAARGSQWKRKGKYKEHVERNKKALPEGWVWSTYDQVGSLQLGRQRAPKYHAGPNMRPYLRVQNVFEDRIDLSDVMEMDFPPNDFEKYQLGSGDLLLNEGQSPELLGRPAVYRGELPGACFTNTLIRFRAADGVSVEFALLVSRHHMHAGRFLDESTITTNIAHLSVGRLATVEFPVPPAAEQLRIVAELDRRFSLLSRIESEINLALRRAERLRHAILAKAFHEDLGARLA